MLRKAAISQAQKKMFWKEVCLLNGILSMGVFILYFLDILKNKTEVFRSQMIVLALIALLANVSMMFRYISYPSRVEKIDKNGFIYVPVMGRKRSVRWENIVLFKKYEKTQTIGIFFKTKIGVVGRPINYQLGKKIQEAWERWKEEQKTKK